MSPFGSVGGRLAVALLTVVVGVLTIVYLIVVPSYQRSLQNSEIRGLESSLRAVALKRFPKTHAAEQLYASSIAPQVDARVIVFDILETSPLV